MRFNQLPCRLRLYILGHALVMTPLLWSLTQRAYPTDAGLVGLLLLFTVIFSTWKVDLTVFQGRITPTFAVVCLALQLQGPLAAVLCAAVGAWVGTVVRPGTDGWKVQWLRAPLYQSFFNIANCTVACGTASLVFLSLTGGHTSDLVRVLGLIVFTVLYFAVNTVGVSLALALRREQGWMGVWRENFLWTAPGFLASASAAAGIKALHFHMGAWALLLLPPVYLVYYTYRLYMQHLRLFSEKAEQDRGHIEDLGELNQAIISSLAMAIKAKDRYTCSHISRVQHLAVTLAQAADVSEQELQAVSTGALVHDIGKLAIPDHILGKPGKLTPEEFARIQSHVAIGAEILEPIPFPFPVVDVVRTHHERWDGLGYPAGLKGEEIPIGGRIISLADVFDALTSDRPYRRALSVEEASRIILDGAGKQFDPRLAELFVALAPQAVEEVRAMEEEHRSRSSEASDVWVGATALAQISQSAVEIAAVADVAHTLAESKTIDQIIQSSVGRALALMPVDTAVLYLTGAVQMELVAAAVDGEHADRLQGMTIRMGEGVAGWVAENREALVNASASLDVARRFTPKENMELSAVTAVPLVHGQETLGVLAVYTRAYSVLTEHHLKMLNILAEHAAAAIQSLRRIERNEELALTDPLTKLTNSRGLVHHLEALMSPSVPALAGESGFSLLMLDLDRFKEVNDKLGHMRGDDVLCIVAATLKGLLRGGDLVCRYAGDEFVMVLPGTGREQAERISARLRQTVDELPAVDGQVKIGASMGVAVFPEDGCDMRTLLQVADQGMYADSIRRKQEHVLAALPAPAVAVS